MQLLHCWWWWGWWWWGWPSSTWLESITFESGEESQDPPWQQTFQIIDTCLSQNQTVWKPDWLLPVSHKGIEFQLWCIFGGTPLPEIRWTKKGGALPQGRTTYDNYGKTLVIKHVDYEDEGDYTCEASNGVGIAKSYSISLAVHASPYFTKVSP